MTRRGGSGSLRSRRSRGSRDPVAAHEGWAPIAPPREAPARPGTSPLRDRRAGPSRVAAAAAMSPGKPGAGGAGTRRTGWRRRRRRRRLEAASGEPLERTAGPDLRGPGTFQGARGMKPAAREARPPRRSPGLRWVLPPLLLLCRLGQILCADGCSNVACPLVTVTSTTAKIHAKSCLGRDIEVVSISPTSVYLTWDNSDSAAPNYTYEVKSEMKEGKPILHATQSSINITDLSPGTLYTFSITPKINETLGNAMCINVKTEPLPVSDLRVAFVSVTQVLLTWKNNEGTATCRMLLEDLGSCQELNQTSAVNITDLKPGTQCNYTLPPWESSEAQSNPPDGEFVSDAVSPEIATHTAGNSTAPVGNSSSVDPLPRVTEVRLLGLKSGTSYKATIYSQASTGEEGQPQAIEFRTNTSQVSDIKAVNISATSMTLTWTINDNEPSSVYTYHVQVVGETHTLSLTFNETQAVITALRSGRLYNITVRPFLQGRCGGVPGFLQAYTRPSPVSNLQVTSVTTRSISLAWSSNDSHSFRVLTTQDGAGPPPVEKTTSHTHIVIGDLLPGTKYCFEIFPRGPDGTEGDSKTVCSTTDTSAVFDIHVARVTTTEMWLEWQSTDDASDYIYHLYLESEHGSIQTNSSYKNITLEGLTPGTLYNITIVPEVNGVRGNSNSTAQYTRPSSVSNIETVTGTTEATFRWQSSDAASRTYTYRLLITQDGNASKNTEIITGPGVTQATVTELVPGSQYTVSIFARVGNVTESPAPGCQSFCTDPAPVASFHCEKVPKKSTLVLTWACPPGTNTGFQLEVSREDWDNVTELEGCSSENGTEYRTEVTHLNFSTSYDISITAMSCNKTAPPSQNTCITDITDPPPPDGAPNITSFSHNSLKVQFSGFEASHGPIKAYALLLTTGEANPSVDDLHHTYQDFKTGASATYVTYLITDEGTRAQGSSEVLKYEINVGNESTTGGYYNGKLEPLGSYRACVAGFTNISYTADRLIDGNASYVSFSRYSEAVFLPQDPGVICGAVFGCIFGAMVIVVVGGFIFWRKKRKDAKNNEMSFSQIKPKKSKLIKVENFEPYFKKQQADSNCGFAEEYEDLKLVGIGQPKYAAELAENRGKNRYNNVLPYDISRVKLSVQSQSTDDYINANYMPGYHSKRDFIATQGPLPNTLKDFWRMVWEKNVHAIVMLTKCVEQGRTKCEEYWPSKKAKDYGTISVAMTSEIVLPEWTIRDFSVKNNETSDGHPLRQFHFTSWPDHGVPDTTDLLINFRYLVRDYMKQSPPESPILVHCSAGVGRTGTFIAIDRLIYQMENENTVDVYGIVYDLRMHRPLMVQTEDQYVFLNQCVLDIIRSQKDSKVDLIYQNTTAMTIYENLAPVTTFGQTNGYIA
ncbi:receptor-type tyrosine-protein phosphatase eta [Saccopteryx leptura]|uniref:receptor-type tyrosine-protein phosphatase eta n=1 Tax=Saccopteryx leptura TaxID=249018 RepID=UPI00339D002D